MSEENKPYTITDRRGMSKGQEHPNEVCRVCGSKEVHSKQYGKPTMDCITFLQNKIRELEGPVINDGQTERFPEVELDASEQERLKTGHA